MSTPPLRLLKTAQRRVAVSADVCQRLGVESVWARVGLSEEAALLFRELQSEQCGHSWREALCGVNPEDSLALVRAVEQVSAKKRPTQLFTYWGVGASGEALLAVAAISSHVRHGFPHEGFPVVARCMVRRCYRGLGLYPFLLAHRIACCQENWGGSLRGIHVGASDPAVISSLAQRSDEALRFVCVGRECLRVGEETFWVPDYFAPTPFYRRAIQEELMDSNPLIGSFARELDSFLMRGASAVSFGTLRDSARVVRTRHGERWWNERKETRGFFSLMESIGVLQD